MRECLCMLNKSFMSVNMIIIGDFYCSQETTTMTVKTDDVNLLRAARMHRVMNKLKSVSVSN